MRRVRALTTGLLLAAGLLVAVLLAAGCSHYGFSSSGGSDFSTIAVPILENETLEYGASVGITDALIEQFTTDNTLRVVGQDEAESILRGTVVLYERPVMSYDAGGNPLEYKVRVVARLAYEDVGQGSTIWEEDVEGWAVYSPGETAAELTTEEEAQVRAYEKLAEDVLSKTVQGW